ncbi:allantoate amidohydrolase [Bauldia sp.]|uniref:allantoate amidohydrolase n=1 Tax=Bauldia sp. TaxID=2575872 RepID=UPI003BA9F2B3
MTIDRSALAERAQGMIDALASISAEPGRLTRLYLSEEHKAAARLVSEWMRDAGLTVRMDAAGSVRGTLPAGRSAQTTERRLLIGSHIDTVVDGGRFDGTLGVIAGILAVENLRARGVALPFGLEVIAFGDEEGVRFPKTLIGSSTVAGILDTTALDTVDADGVTMSEALRAFGGDPHALDDEAYASDDVLGYLEVHIEQGPVLEQAGKPLGAVSAIASQGRYRITIIGEAGHAGTVPMAVRHDALAAAAEVILAIEAAATKRSADSCVATVGALQVSPGASNVIPGAATFSLDLRAATDESRTTAAAEVRDYLRDVGHRRGVKVSMDAVHEKPVATCAPRLGKAIGGAIERVTGAPPVTMMSGAGHDGQAMVSLTEIGMMFVRCRGGISHNPLEFVEPDDMGVAVLALSETVRTLADDSGQG